MIVIKDKVENKIEYPLERLGNVDHMIYFDIETTGFSRKYCMVYMIGCMYFVNGEPIYTQWVAENANDEANVLMAFHKFIQNYKIIIHFNGNTFDMPFLKERGEKYNMNFDFDSFESIDIYKTVKKYSDLLKLENNKQKTYEDFLGIKRNDPFSGGDLIEVYKEFMRTHDEMLVFPLLLHNKEDVWYMGTLTSLLSLNDFFEGNYTLNSYEIRDYKSIDGIIGKELYINLDLEVYAPFTVTKKTDYIYFKLNGNNAQITIISPHLLLKYFFKNYKDYYYLPEEDITIHKDVATYVDKNHRIQATASNCFTKVTDNFLPIFSVKNPDFNQIFIENYGEKNGFIQLKSLKDEDCVLKYVKCILDYLY